MSNDNQISKLKDLGERLEKAKESKMKIEALLEQVEYRKKEQIDFAKKEYLNDESISDENVLPELRKLLVSITKSNEEKLNQFESEVINLENRISEISKSIDI